MGARTLTGATAPITIESKPEGNVLPFVAGDPPVLECRTFAGAALEALREQGVPLRLNHYSDCPSVKR